MAEAFFLNVAQNVCGNVVDRTLIRISNPITAVFRWKKNVENLEDKLTELDAKRKTVQHQKEAAIRKGQEIELEVENWMGDANKYIDDEEKKKSMEELVKEASVKKCCFGWCPNPKPRYKLSKKAEEDALAVAGLVKKACEIKNFGYFPDPKEVVAAPDKDFENFDSRMDVLENIIKALQSRNVNRIGVHGMPGVGKRTLVMEVKRKAEKFFDAVVIASVTKNQKIKKIQEQIAADLGLELDSGISTMVAAQRINARLMKKKRVLVILVDIWKKIDLEEVGIPNRPRERNREEKEVAIPYGNEYEQPTERKKEENSSVEECFKILITSTDRNVLLSYMRAHEIFEVNQLEYREALELFMKIVGKDVERHGLFCIALKIVQECGGLPLAITTLGEALRTRSLDEWEDALRQLKSHTPSDKVNSAIEFSFKQLEGDELKKTFFLCSLLGCNASIEDLLKYAVGLDLFHGVHSIQEARARAITLINKLKDSSLLVDGHNNMHFNVNDVVHVFAISIASRDHGMLVFGDGNTPKEFSNMEAMQKLSWICSSGVDIFQLENLEKALANNPQSEYQQLELFHLSDLSVALPGNFFGRMEKLKVLDLTKMYLSPMPSSISHLTTLRSLRLDQSMLGIKDIAAIGELRNLQVLSLVGCAVEELPKEIANLERLKLFDLTDCAQLKVIPPDVIGSLSGLEELKMGNSFDQWEVKHHGNRKNASLDELLQLQNLTALEVRICDAQMIPSDSFFEKLNRYKIFMGDVENDWRSSFESTKVLKLKMNPGFVLNKSFPKLLKMTDELHMEDSFDVPVVDELDYEGFQDLKYLYILHDQNIQQISKCSLTPNTFPKLEVLSLQKLEKLEKIFQGSFRGTSFKELKVITVGLCDQLKNLFSSSIARQLLQLQEITVTNCSNIKEIVDDDEQGNKNDVEATKMLDQLRCLKLQDLPQLISFCHEKNSASSSRGLPIFYEKVMFAKIEELQLSWINVNSIWHTSVASTSVNNLTKLIIVGCNLEYIFSSSMARGLLKLTHLEIRDCKSLNEVIFTDNVEERENLIFEHLKFLQIKDLQNLTRFYSGSCVIEFQSLKVLSIENCPKLKGFIVTTDVASTQHLFNKQVAFPTLEQMTISHLKKLESIWQNQLFEDSFCKLQILRVAFCENLWTIFPSNNMLESFWKSLEELSIIGCGSLKVVFELGGIIKSDAAIVTRLKILKIQSLARLEYIWTKDSQGIISFENLESVLAYNCPSLKNLFPASVASSLLKLQKLWIESCGVEEIAAMEGRGTEEVVRFVFPQVSCLVIGNLPRLRYFYPEEHKTEWPRLKKFYFEGGVKKTTWHWQLEFLVQQPLFSAKKVIPPPLEKLSLTRDDIAMICKGQFREDLFYNIKVLRISYYEDESDILPISFLNRFHNLKKLVVKNCFFNDLFYAKELEDVSLRQSPIANMLFPSSQEDVENQEKHIEELRLKYILGQDATVFQKLETLKVWHCDGLISLSTLPASCWNLTTLEVWNCQRMENLFSVSSSKRLGQLKRMTIRQCYELTGIVGNERDGTEQTIDFLNLEYLKLEYLTTLKMFCSGKFIFNFPSLEQLIVDQCPELKMFCGSAPKTPKLKHVQSIGGEDKQFWEGNLNSTIQQMYTNKVGYGGLKYLRLTDFPELLRKWHANSHETLVDFRLLQSLEICGCSNLECLLTRSMVLNLVQLLELKVVNCTTMDQVIKGDEMEDKMICPLLRFIHLESCSKLTSFYVGSCTFELPSLVKITVADCPKMATFTSTFPGEQEKEASRYFFNNKVDFSNLELLKFSSLNVQEIWHNSLPELSSFVQNLTKIIVHGCDNLKYLFTSSMVKSFGQLNWLEVRCCAMMERVIASEKLAEKEKMCGLLFPRLDTLQLEDLPKLTGFCSANYTEFSYLTQPQISKCPVLKTFISSTTTEDMAANQNYTPSLFDEKVSFPCLERLTIIHLGSLNKIWHNLLDDVGSFPQLTYLSVDSCEKLLTIFPFSMWKRLQKLETLLIQHCPSLKDIFEPYHGSSAGQAQALLATQPTSNGATAEFVFSKLTDLKFYDLPNLKCFYPKVHTIEFSSLRKLEVYGCSEIQMFASEFQSSTSITGDYQLEIQIPRPLFWVDKATFLSLEQLKLEWNVIMKEIWHREYSSREYFPNLKVLELIHFHEQSAVLSSFIQSLANLEKLVVTDASFDKIFHYEALGDEEKTTHLLPKLLRYNRKESQRKPVVLNNLTTLEVHECSKLKNLVPTLVYFENLQILEVSKCHGLTNLVRYSTAKRLVQLKRMAISHCDMIEEVVACLDGEVKDGIEFGQLKCLQLCGLPRLSSFCSVKCRLEFPSLEEVTVMECPKMKIFSRVEPITKRLEKVLLTGDRWLWEGNLNSTIQKSYIEKVIMSDNLKLFIVSLFVNFIIYFAKRFVLRALLFTQM